MCTQNIKALKPGSGAPACCINDIGRLLFDMVVYVRADEILLELDGPLRDKAMEWLDRHVITEDVVVEDVSNQFLALELAGPTAVSAFPGLPEAPFGVADHEGAILLGSHGTGTATWQLWVRPGRIDTLWSQLHAKARPYGLEAWETLRQEAGHPVYGQDMDEENNPLEADLHAAVSLDKGCYTGQEVMARLTFRQGPVRSRMGLRSSELLARGEELLWQDKPMARVSSSTQSPTLGYPIAMGYVRRECKAPGTALRRANGGTVEVVDVPWVK
jgi:folate-binding protein YgfZ